MEKISTVIEKAFDELVTTINDSLTNMSKEVNTRMAAISQARKELNAFNEEVSCVAEIVENASDTLGEIADNAYGISNDIEDFLENEEDYEDTEYKINPADETSGTVN